MRCELIIYWSKADETFVVEVPEALQRGMTEKSKEFVEKGVEVYAKA